MENADKPINPCMMQRVDDNTYRASKERDPKEYNVPTEGLTKREYFAAKAMQGLVTPFMPGSHNSNAPNHNKENAIHAVALADALIEALDKDLA